MRSLTSTDDLSAFGDTELERLLAQLEREERSLSRRRNALQGRIDFLRAGGFASTGPSVEPLEPLLESEQEISEQRRLLHRQIDLVRAEDNRRRARR